MRLVFAGTPQAAVPSLRVLAASGHDIPVVVTRPDAPVGRRRTITASPVGAAADDLGIPTVKTARLDEAATGAITATAPDLGVIVAYGGLVREPLLSAPVHGWINLHFSLLPRWRGAAPVQHALLAGDAETGAAVFQLVAELDAGDVYAERRYAISPRATAAVVLDDLAGLGAELLRDVVAEIESGTATATPQQGEPSFAPKLSTEDGVLRWDEPAEALVNRVRGVTPEPGAHTTVDGARLGVLGAYVPDEKLVLAPGEIALHGSEVYAGTGTTAIVIDRVQPAGRTAMAAGDWRRGIRSESVRVGT
jgi:methionyl-tRNA formyltransferase